MDSHFSFLTPAQSESLIAVLARRRSALYGRVRQNSEVSQVDAEEILAALSDELADNLDDDWEPTDYGREISALLARFNAARLEQWP